MGATQVNRVSQINAIRHFLVISSTSIRKKHSMAATHDYRPI
jgi:hypothetical protein